MGKKILITGSNGQLGREVNRLFGDQYELVLTDVHNLDITNYKQVQKTFQQVKPQGVVHCAAYTNVDGAERDFDGAFKVNVIGSQNIAAQCIEHNARMVYVSTDYVFNGQANAPYREYDQTDPLGVYGKTKYLGEQMVRQILGRHYIVRTAWLYGEGNNFVRTMLKLAQERDKLQVVNDQIGSPTSTTELANTIFRLLATDCYGTYHATCNDHCSWYDFACKIFELARVKIQVEPVTSEQFVRPAPRPKYSVLENYMLKMTVGDEMAPWEDALKRYLGIGI